MEIGIRRAELSDAELLAATIVAAFAEYGPWLVPPSGALNETAETIGAELSGEYGGAVAQVEGVVAGCVLFRLQGEDMYFGRLSVLPEHRRMGVAEALVAWVEGEALARGCAGTTLSVRLALESNQRLFGRLGYRETARHSHPGFAEPTFMDMRKAIVRPTS